MNKNNYYPTYILNPESIYGSGIVTTQKDIGVDRTTSVTTDSFAKDRKKTPPLYHVGVSKKPLSTNGYRILKKGDTINNKIDNYYYTSQQSNNNMIPKIIPTIKDKIKKTVEKISNDKEEIKDIIKKVGKEPERTKDGRNKKMWIDDHYLYSLEPRYRDVVYPWRAYTWTYPISPNTDNYYIDNINSSPADPIIVSNDVPERGNYQFQYLKSNLLHENFEMVENDKSMIYFIIIILGVILITSSK